MANEKYYENNYSETFQHHQKKQVIKHQESFIRGVENGNLTLFSKGAFLSMITLTPNGKIILSVSSSLAPNKPISWIEICPTGVKGAGFEGLNFKGLLPSSVHNPINVPPIYNFFVPFSDVPSCEDPTVIEEIRECLRDSSYFKPDEQIIEFQSGVESEIENKDGTKTITKTDGSIIVIDDENKQSVETKPDGTVIIKKENEDGTTTTNTTNPDGTTETITDNSGYGFSVKNNSKFYKPEKYQYLECDFKSISFVDPIVIIKTLNEIYDRILDPKIIEEIEEKSKFICHLTVEEIAEFLKTVTLVNANPFPLDPGLKDMAKQELPDIVVQILEKNPLYFPIGDRVRTQLDLPGILVQFVQQICTKINCILSVIYYIDDLRLPSEDEALLEKTAEVTYYNLNDKEKIEVDRIENDFINNFFIFIETLESCYGELPELAFLIGGSCLDNIDDVIRIFGSVIQDEDWFKVLKDKLKDLTDDDIFLKSILSEVSNYWTSLPITDTIRKILTDLFNAAKGEMINVLRTVMANLLVALEPLRRIMDFIQPGIAIGQVFLQTLGQLIGVSAVPLPSPFSDLILSYLQRGILFLERKGVVKKLKHEICKNELEELIQKKIREEKEKAEIEKLLKRAGDRWNKVKDFTDKYVELELEYNNKNILGYSFQGEIWFTKEENIASMEQSRQKGEFGTKTKSKIQNELDNTLPPLRRKYLNDVFSDYKIKDIKNNIEESLESVLYRAKESFNSKTNKELVATLKDILIEGEYFDAFGSVYTIEPLFSAKDRLEVEKNMWQNKLNEINDGFASLNQNLNVKQLDCQNILSEQEIIRLTIEQAKKDLNEIENSASEMAIIKFASQVLEAISNIVTQIPEDMLTELASFFFNIMSAVVTGDITSADDVKDKLEESKIFDALNKGPIYLILKDFFNELNIVQKEEVVKKKFIVTQNEGNSTHII